MSKRVVVIALLVVLFAAGVVAAVVVIHAQMGLRAAEDMLEHQLWPQARERLAAYLWLHPDDAQARLMMADAYVKDDALPSNQSATQAIRYLAEIPDSSPHAAEAKFRESGFYFLLLQRPGKAEQLLREAIELGEGLRAYQLLWTLMNFTGRYEDTEDIFWRVYELSPDDQRPLRLREWYLTQFFPTTANEYLDRMMGIIDPEEEANRSTESRRYLRLREREPEAPVNHAAIAQWCQQEGDPEFAIRILDVAKKELPTAMSDRFFLSVSIATYLDLGRFDEARACFDQWPEDDRGHAYWKWRAIILDEVLGQYDAALEAYDRALVLWPGPIDLRLHYRKEACLNRLKQHEEAAALKERIEQLKELMTDQRLDRLKVAVSMLNDPEQLAEVAQFYRQLGRDREADGWQSYIERLQAPPAESR